MYGPGNPFYLMGSNDGGTTFENVSMVGSQNMSTGLCAAAKDPCGYYASPLSFASQPSFLIYRAVTQSSNYNYAVTLLSRQRISAPPPSPPPSASPSPPPAPPPPAPANVTLIWPMLGTLVDRFQGLGPTFINGPVSYVPGPFPGTTAYFIDNPLTTLANGQFQVGALSPHYDRPAFTCSNFHPPPPFFSAPASGRANTWIEYTLPSQGIASPGYVSPTANAFTTLNGASFTVACWVNSLVAEYPSKSTVLYLPSGLYGNYDTGFGLNGGTNFVWVFLDPLPKNRGGGGNLLTTILSLAGLSAAGAFLIAAVSPPNAWYLTSATFNSSTASLYFNGTLQGTLPFGQDFVRILIVGSNGQGGAFAGAVTGLQMWNRALAPSEHAALMAGPTSLPPAPPPSSPSPPPGAPLLRDNFLTLTTSNPPAGVVVISGPPEDVISYTGYCQDEYKEQARASPSYTSKLAPPHSVFAGFAGSRFPLH